MEAEHSIWYSRARGGFTEVSEDEKATRQPLVLANPRTGEKALYLASHASHIIGWPVEKGRKLLEDLVSTAAQPRFVYAHKWRQYDFVIWDNRCVLHRGTAFESDKCRRVMRRTTVAGVGPTVSEAGEALAVA